MKRLWRINSFWGPAHRLKICFPYIIRLNTGFSISIMESYFQFIALAIAKMFKIHQQQVSFLDGHFILFSPTWAT